MGWLPRRRGRRISGVRWALVAACLATVVGCGKRAPEKPTLYLYCAAGIREPVADAIAQFEQAHGVTVQADYAGSNILLSKIKLRQEGDLYMPGDADYVRQAEAEGLIASSKDVCYFIPVILVVKGNPKRVTSLSDLARPGVRLGLGEPKACAIGATTVKLLEKNKMDMAKIEANTELTTGTVNELGLQIKAGKLDAVIVWDAIAKQYADAGEIVEIPREQNLISTVPVAVLRCSEKPELAAAFQEFIASEQGRAIFAEHGYSTELAE